MAKIPFSIDYRPQIESGEYKVETRDDRPVRIICWDASYEDLPIVGLIGGRERPDIFTREGSFFQ